MKVDNTTSMQNNYNSAYKKETGKTVPAKTENEGEKVAASKESNAYGKTIGNAKLSEEGARYYEKLKKKYSNMEFILVSKDQKANAQANAGKYANAKKMVVLIDEEKIERMATDEKYRMKYEGIIGDAASGLSQLKSQIENQGLSGNVKGYGMKVNDGGTASFFAVLKKSSSDQKARIEKKAAEKREANKAADKKAEKKAKEEKLDESRDVPYTEDSGDDTVTITANSIEELLQKINDYSFTMKSDTVQTEAEKGLGQHIDFRG